MKEIEKLKELAYKDELTKLYNRRGFKERRKKTLKKNFSLITFDIDNFKKLNDRHGHPAGDKALKFLSNLILGRVREGDLVARWGGEEIVIGLIGANEDNAFKIADDIKEKLENSRFSYHGQKIKFTVSGGVASFGKAKNFEKLFERADKALYKAKKLGKNRIVKYSDL